VALTIESIGEADVPPAAVFALYADPSTWSRWGHNATWARSDGPLVEGGIVEVRAGYGTVYRCEVRRLQPDRALELVVRPFGLTIVNVYEVEPAGTGSRIRHAFEISGPLTPFVRLTIARTYRRKLADEIAAVARIAGGEDPGPPPSAASPVTRGERAWHRLGRLGRRARPSD
jgi:hypothetical protein